MIALITNLSLYYGHENKNVNTNNLGNAAFEAFDSFKTFCSNLAGQSDRAMFPTKTKGVWIAS